MALDKLTKIDGGGISTTSDYRVGVITATKFVGPFEGTITSTDANFTCNVSIAGTLTYEDVTNIDSVGIITARNGIFLPDNKKLELGNASGSGDLSIYHDGSHSYIDDGGTGNLYIQSNHVNIDSKNGEQFIGCLQNGGVDLYFNNNLRLSSANYGANIFGQSAAVSFGLYTEGGTKRGGLYATNGNVISLLDAQDHSILRGVKDGAAELYFDNGKKLETIDDGVQVTGSTGSFLKIRTSGGYDSGLVLTVNNNDSTDWSIRNDESDSNKLDFRYNGTKKMHLTSSGDLHLTGEVGIGTDNPTVPLEVRSSNNTLGILSSTDSGANLDLFDDDTQTRIRSKDGRLQIYADFGGQVADSSIRFYIDGNNEKLRIDSSGNVLSSGNTQLFGSNTSDGSDNKSIMINGGGAVSDSRGGYLLVHGNEHSSNPGVTRLHAGNVGNAFIAFNTAGNERLRIDAYGRVLIGGTSAIIGSSSEFNEIVLTGKTRGAGITLQDVDANTRFQIRTDDNGDGTLLNASTNHPLVIRTNNTERFRILQDGKVGINSATPFGMFDVVTDFGLADNLYKVSTQYRSGNNASGYTASGLQIVSSAINSGGEKNTAYLSFSNRDPALNGSHGASAFITMTTPDSPGTYGTGQFDFYCRNGAPYAFPNDPQAASNYWMDSLFTIKSNGKIGINSTSPQAGFDVTHNDGAYIKSVTNGNGAKIRFSDNTGENYTQIGTIEYKHVDNQVVNGTQEGFLISGSENTTAVQIDGLLKVTAQPCAVVYQCTGPAGGAANAASDNQEPLHFDHVHINQGGMTISNNNARIQVPVAGIYFASYMVSGTVTNVDDNDGIELVLLVNGNEYPATNSGAEPVFNFGLTANEEEFFCNNTLLVSLSKDDYVEVAVDNIGNSDANINRGNFNVMLMS